jgi:GT2 family glycosyltransferase
MSKKPFVSIILCTIGRPTQTKACIASIQKNIYKNFEIILVRQGLCPIRPTQNIIIVDCLPKGLGYARNTGIRHSKGELLVFTDDDCVVSEDWLLQIIKRVRKTRNAAAYFGRVLPYQVNMHQYQICPSMVEYNSLRIYTKPINPPLVGSGNNMIIKRQTIVTCGFFKDWLGPGSVGKNADDTEMILRLLSVGEHIVFDPSIVVYHNRWISVKEYRIQFLEYLFGETACFMYHGLSNNNFAIKHLISLFKKHVPKLMYLQNKQDVLQLILGSFVGCRYFIRENIFKNI